MRGRKTGRAFLVFMLVVALPVSLAAMGGKENQAAGGGAKRAVVDLGWIGQTGMQGTLEDPIAQVVLDKLQIRLTCETLEQDKFKVRIAGDDLADIIFIAFNETEKQLLEGGHLMDVTELAKKHAPDILKEHPEAVAFQKKYHSLGTGKLYIIPRHMGTKIPPYDIYPLGGVYARWDYYKELGYPALKSYDDVLGMLKEMQDAHPTTADGRKVYGFSSWTDWGIWPYFFPFCLLEGSINHTDWMFIGADGKTFNPYTDPDSLMWEGVKFLNKANRLGLLDPDFFTLKYTDYSAKVNAGQILMPVLSWPATAANTYFAKQDQTNVGFGLLPLEGKFVPVSSRDASVLGRPDNLAIWAKSKHPDRALELLNFFTTFEGSRLGFSGIKGKHWDVLNGVAQMLPETLDMQKKMEAIEFNKKTGIGAGWYQMTGYAGVCVDPADGGRIDLLNDPLTYAQTMLPIEKDYCSHWGVKQPGEAAVNWITQGRVKDVYLDYSPQQAMPIFPDDLNKVDVKCEQYVARTMPKAVLAQTDQEFQQVKDEMIQTMKGYGFDKSYEWFKAQWGKAYAEVKSLAK